MHDSFIYVHKTPIKRFAIDANDSTASIASNVSSVSKVFTGSMFTILHAEACEKTCEFEALKISIL